MCKQISKYFIKTPFWGTSKVCADLSLFLVFKNGLKKFSSLTNDWVIEVWSQYKKCDEGEKGRGGGPARVWGSDYKYN